MYASKTRKEKFSGPGENCQRNVTDLAGSLVTSSRPPGRLQKRRDDRTWNAGVAVRTADGSRQTADAGDEQCLRCGCSSPSCTVVLSTYKSIVNRCYALSADSNGYAAVTMNPYIQTRTLTKSYFAIALQKRHTPCNRRLTFANDARF